jgi:hypothetical protein
MGGKKEVLARASTSRGIFWGSLGLYNSIGDFNSILYQGEKKRGRHITSSSNRGLLGVVQDQGLIDLNFSGLAFTWSNKRSGAVNIKEKLDRALANTRWCELFPRALVKHFPPFSSDHAPIVLYIDGELTRLPKPFKFEEIWTRDETSDIVIENAWRTLVPWSPLFKVCTKIKETKKNLKKWNKEHFGIFQSRIKEAWNQLERIQNLDSSPEHLQMEANISVEIQELLKMEETLWKQKSKEQWLTSSDLNTRFFYLSTVIRRRRNYIEFMKDEHGSWFTKREDIGQCFCRNFVKLFNSNIPQFPLNLGGLVPCCISEEEND